MPGPYSGLPLEWLWLGIALKEGDRRNGICFQTSSSSIFPVISWFFFLCFFSLLLEPTWCGGLCGYALCRGVDSGSFEAWLVIIAKADRHVRALCRPESELGGLASPVDSRGKIRVSKGVLELPGRCLLFCHVHLLEEPQHHNNLTLYPTPGRICPAALRSPNTGHITQHHGPRSRGYVQPVRCSQPNRRM